MNQFAALKTDYVRKKLASTGIFNHIVYLETTTSTSDVARALPCIQDKHGTLIVAEEQTAGRGRKKNRWFSPKGKGLYFTLVLNPPEMSNVQLITLAAGVALTEAMENTCGLATKLKWPNDVYVRDRKLAGILTEAISRGKKLLAILVGIGINVNHEKGDLAEEIRNVSTSLKIAANKTVSREELLVNVLKSLDLAYRKLLRGSSGEILKCWLEKAAYLGERVVVTNENTSIEGEFIGLSNEGALLLRDYNNNVHEIWAADVIRCRKL